MGLVYPRAGTLTSVGASTEFTKEVVKCLTVCPAKESAPFELSPKALAYRTSSPKKFQLMKSFMKSLLLSQTKKNVATNSRCLIAPTVEFQLPKWELKSPRSIATSGGLIPGSL